VRVFIEKFYTAYGEKLPADFLSQLDRNFERLVNNRKLNATVVQTDYTVVETDNLVIYVGTGGTIYLPHAVEFSGYAFTVKHAGSGTLVIDATNKGQIFSSDGLTNTITLASGDGADFTAGNNTWQIV
jgi:hypothetical protein